MNLHCSASQDIGKFLQIEKGLRISASWQQIFSMNPYCLFTKPWIIALKQILRLNGSSSNIYIYINKYINIYVYIFAGLHSVDSHHNSLSQWVRCAMRRTQEQGEMRIGSTVLFPLVLEEWRVLRDNNRREWVVHFRHGRHLWDWQSHAHDIIVPGRAFSTGSSCCRSSQRTRRQRRTLTVHSWEGSTVSNCNPDTNVRDGLDKDCRWDIFYPPFSEPTFIESIDLLIDRSTPSFRTKGRIADSGNSHVQRKQEAR